MKKYVDVPNGNENENQHQQEAKKENIFSRTKKKVSGFKEKHPKIAKGVKIAGCVLGAAAIGVGAYKAGQHSGGSSEVTPEVPDLFLPGGDVPALPDNELVPFEELTESISETIEELPELAETA